MLQEKKKEIERLRGWGSDSRAKPDTVTNIESHSHSTDAHYSDMLSHSHSSNPVHTPLKRNTPSSSRKRHASIIEAKSRQLVEEEGLAFKQMKMPAEGVESEEGATPPPVSSLLHIPAPDRKWYEDTTEHATPQKGVGLRNKGRLKKSVHFDAEAIVLNAALEGELVLLKQCIGKVRKIVVTIYLLRGLI